MSPLDPITTRLFPTLAARERQIRLRVHLLGYGFAFLVGVAATVAFLGYHLHVATMNLQVWGPRIAVLEAQYERDHKSALTITKTQANDFAWAKVKKEQN